MPNEQRKQEVGGDFPVPAKNREVINRLRSAIEAAGGRKAVSARSGISLGTLNGALDDKTDVGFLKMAAIAQACGVSIDWIVYGPPPVAQSGIPDSGTESADFSVMLPRFAVRASAGHGQSPFAEAPVDQMIFDRRWLDALGAHPSACFVMSASGDSAWPTVEDGALIVVDRSRVDTLDGGLYVLRVGDHLYLKRVQQLASGGLRLKSDNPVYSPEDVAPSDLARITIIGRVVWPSATPRRV